MTEKQRPEVVIESAEPYSGSSGESEEENGAPKRPSRLNAYATGISHGHVPRGMRPANSTIVDVDEETEEEPPHNKQRETLSLTHPLVLVAASIGIGLLISYYGAAFIKPAVDKVVEAAEEIIDENK